MDDGFDPLHALNSVQRPVIATIATANFERVVNAYEEVFGYELISSTRLQALEARHWMTAGLEGARLALMRPQSGAPIFLRFVEVAVSKPQVTMSCGWFALEICVRDVEALYERLMKRDDFRPFSAPSPMPHTDRVYPMQCMGPAGEILYLNQVRGNLPEIDLPIASCDVDHLFIAILSAPHMETSIQFYSELLGMSVNEQLELPYKTINRIHGLPLDTYHKLSTLGGVRQVALEVDQYPISVGLPSPLNVDTISEGILMVSFTVDSFSSETINETTSQIIGSTPYNGAESLICLGPGGERIELIKLPT